MIRDVTIRDIVRLEKNATFPVEHINRPKVLQKTYEEEGKLIASAFVTVTTETAIIFSSDASSLERARAVKDLFITILKDLKERGIQDNHMFIEDPEFASLIEKHLKFERATGIAMVKQLNG